MSGGEESKRKFSSAFDKSKMNGPVTYAGLRSGFLNPVPKITITMESLVCELEVLWKESEEMVLDLLPLEILISIFSQCENPGALARMCKILYHMTRSVPFRCTWINEHVPQYARGLDNYVSFRSELFGLRTLSEVVQTPSLWKQLIESKKTMTLRGNRKNAFPVGSMMLRVDYRCGNADWALNMYEGQCASSEIGLKPHGLGVAYLGNVCVSGEWVDGNFRKGALFIRSQIIVELHATTLVEDLVLCRGVLHFNPNAEDGCHKFEGEWIHTNFFTTEVHPCTYLDNRRIVNGSLFFPDRILSGLFIDNTLAFGTCHTLETGEVETVDYGERNYGNVVRDVLCFARVNLTYLNQHERFRRMVRDLFE